MVIAKVGKLPKLASEAVPRNTRNALLECANVVNLKYFFIGICLEKEDFPCPERAKQDSLGC